GGRRAPRQSRRNARGRSGGPQGRYRDRILDMPSAAETLIARLQADCTAAETAERTVRASVDAQIKAAEQARTFAWRRLNALSDMARAAAREPDREAAVEGQLVALFRQTGWVESGLCELGDGRSPLIERLLAA